MKPSIFKTDYQFFETYEEAISTKEKNIVRNSGFDFSGLYGFGKQAGNSIVGEYYNQVETPITPLLTLNWMRVNELTNQAIIDITLSKPIDAGFKQVTLKDPTLTREENDKVNYIINNVALKNQKTILQSFKTLMKTGLPYGTAFMVVFDDKNPKEEFSCSDVKVMDIKVVSWWEMLPFKTGSKERFEQSQAMLSSYGNHSSLTLNYGYFLQNSEYFYFNDVASGKYGIKVHRSRVKILKNESSEHLRMYDRILQTRGVSIFENKLQIIAQLVNFFHSILPQAINKTNIDVITTNSEMFNLSDEEASNLKASYRDFLTNYLKQPGKSAYATPFGTEMKFGNFNTETLKTAVDVMVQLHSAFFPYSNRGFWGEEQKSHTSEVEAINKEERSLDYIRLPYQHILIDIAKSFIYPCVIKTKPDIYSPVEVLYIKKEPSLTEKTQELLAKSSILTQGIDKNIISQAEARQVFKDFGLLPTEAPGTIPIQDQSKEKTQNKTNNLKKQLW